MLEKQQWKTALEQFMRSQTIYSELAKVADTDMRDVCNERVTEIRPSIRFCRYQLGEEGFPPFVLLSPPSLSLSFFSFPFSSLTCLPVQYGFLTLVGSDIEIPLIDEVLVGKLEVLVTLYTAVD